MEGVYIWYSDHLWRVDKIYYSNHQCDVGVKGKGYIYLKSVQIVKPLSHWTATVLRQLATDIASGSQSSLETVASDS